MPFCQKKDEDLNGIKHDKQIKTTITEKTTQSEAALLLLNPVDQNIDSENNLDLGQDLDL